MSYINEKEKMSRESKAHRETIWRYIRYTFFALAGLLVLFCISLTISLLIDPESDDEEAPVIEGPRSVVGYVGDIPTYRDYVTVTDNVDANIVPQVYAEGVDINKVGSYRVYYVAIDSAGNKSHQFTLIYEVKSAEYSDKVLMAQIAEISEEIGITENMSKEAKVRKIYTYVNSKSTIRFTDESNIPNINRNKWESDWVEEAIRALDTGDGDCYSYYSLSKAFFEYWGIENRGIKRAENYEGASDENDGTHFWSIVKVEQGWYYYDATRLNGKFNDGTLNACLITQAKIDSYRANDSANHPCPDYFYRMVKPVGFPTISTKELG